MPEDDKLRGQVNVAFRFVVSIDGETQAAFTDCRLPEVTWDVEEVKEGGLNSYVHQLPGQRRPVTITLKNGVGKSALVDWYLDIMEGNLTRKPVTVTLLDPMKETVMVWQLSEAFPTKWTGPDLKSDSNAVAIQTLELAGGEVTVSYE